MLLGDVAHEALLLGGQNHAGGVAGVGAHNGPGVLVDEGLHLGPVSVVIALLGGGGDGTDHAAGGVHHGAVVGIEGLGDEDLIAVVQDGLEDDSQGLAAAGGDEDLVLLKVHVQVVIIFLDCVDQNGHAGRGCVLQNGQLEIAHSLKILRGSLNIGLADVQVINLPALGLSCHCKGVELTHGGQTALFDFAGKLHVLTSV